MSFKQLVELPTVGELQRAITNLVPTSSAYYCDHIPKLNQEDTLTLAQRLYGFLQGFEVGEQL